MEVEARRVLLIAQATAQTTAHHDSSNSARGAASGGICEEMVEVEDDCFGVDEAGGSYQFDASGGGGGGNASNMKYMDDRSHCRKK